MSKSFTFSDILLAYRKAKTDAFYETGHNTSQRFAFFEQDLFQNIKNLLDNLNSGRNYWLNEETFTGNYGLMIKSIEERIPDNKKVYYSNYERQMSENNEYDIEYRIVGQHSVEFHIISSLWIEFVGYKLDKYISRDSYGCRLNFIQDIDLVR